jgi:hypothetical protein
MLWDIPIAILNQGIHTYLYDSGARLMRETLASSSDKLEMAKLIGIEI